MDINCFETIVFEKNAFTENANATKKSCENCNEVFVGSQKMVQQKFYLHIKNKLCPGKPVEKKNNDECKESLELNKNDIKDTKIVGKNDMKDTKIVEKRCKTCNEVFTGAEKKIQQKFYQHMRTKHLNQVIHSKSLFHFNLHIFLSFHMDQT